MHNIWIMELIIILTNSKYGTGALFEVRKAKTHRAGRIHAQDACSSAPRFGHISGQAYGRKWFTGALHFAFHLRPSSHTEVHRSGEIHTAHGPKESSRYEFAAPLGTLIIRGTLVWSEAGTMEDWFILAAATSIVSTFLPITSAEPALFGVYAVDLLSRWRALRGFRKTLEDDHD